VELTIGVDVGGTKIAAGVVDELGQILDRVRVHTPARTEEAVDEGIVDAVLDLKQRHAVSAVGVAAAGFVDARRSTVRFAPNLPWRDHPLRELLTARLGLRVVVENDANAAAWGEFRFGAGAETDDMVLVTVGTGIGGGIVLDGRLLRGAWGVAAEFGHVRVVPGGRLCGCGNHGCWEQYASGSALLREARAAVAADPRAGRLLLELAGESVEKIDGAGVTRAASAGDPLAVAVLTEAGRWLGQGIADLACTLDPAVVVVGGGVSEAGDLLLGPARASFEAQLSAGDYRPHLVILAAALGNDAGMIGAGDLARLP
jgi:glucokinase